MIRPQHAFVDSDCAAERYFGFVGLALRCEHGAQGSEAGRAVGAFRYALRFDDRDCARNGLSCLL
jgi:hypothetical protein